MVWWAVVEFLAPLFLDAAFLPLVPAGAAVVVAPDVDDDDEMADGAVLACEASCCCCCCCGIFKSSDAAAFDEPTSALAMSSAFEKPESLR